MENFISKTKKFPSKIKHTWWCDIESKLAAASFPIICSFSLECDTLFNPLWAPPEIEYDNAAWLAGLFGLRGDIWADGTRCSSG